MNEEHADGVAEPSPVQEEVAAAPAPAHTWPEYQWRGKDAWKCIGMVVLLTELVLPAGYYLLHSSFPAFYHTLLCRVCLDLLWYSVWTITGCYFARTETLAAVTKAFGLDHKPTELVWFGLVMALALRMADHILHNHYPGTGTFNYDVFGFRHTIGFQRVFYLLSPLVLAPVFEEIVNRGFLYKAFRVSSSVGVSIFLMVLWTLWTHYQYWHRAWVNVLYYSAWTALQCYLREKSPSLWDCILCHCVSNAWLFIP